LIVQRRSLFFVGGDFEDGEEGFLRDVHLADALPAASTVNFLTVTYT
jgi:hypothetical protein